MLAITEQLERVAAVMAALGDHYWAVAVIAAAWSSRAAMGAPVPPVEAPGRDATVALLRAALAGDGFDTAWAGGAALALASAVDLALAP